MKKPVLLIGGATGLVGRELVPYLSKNYQNISIRVLTRNPDSEVVNQFTRLPQLEIFKGDFRDIYSLKRAAEGADRAYLACNNVDQQTEYECNFIDACQGGSVGRIVKLATLKHLCRKDGPAHGGFHYHIIEHLKRSGIPYAPIYPTCFFQTLLYFTHFIKTQGILPHLLGDTEFHLIDCRDIAQYLAALLMCEDELFAEFHTKPLIIAGPDKMGGQGWAAALRRHGVNVEYQKVTPEEFRENFLQLGIPRDMVDNITAFHTTFYDGSIPVPDQYSSQEWENLPGVPTQFRRFDDFIEEVAHLFK